MVHNIFRYKTLISFLTISAVALTASCQKTQAKRSKEEKQQDFSQLLNQGRGVNHTGISTTKRGFFLGAQDSNIVEVKRDNESDAISWITYDSSKMAAVEKDDLVSHALEFLKDKQSDFKVDPSDLKLLRAEGIKMPNDMIIIPFTRNIGDLNLRDSYIDFAFSKDSKGTYRLHDIVNRTGGNVSVSNETEASISFERLIEETGSDRLTFVSSKDYILKLESDSGTVFVKTTQFKTIEKGSGETITISAEAGSGKLHEAYSSRVFAKKHTFNGKVLDKSYLDATQVDSPIAFANVVGANTDITLDADGSGDIDDNESAVTINLTSSRVQVLDFAGDGTPVAIPATLTGDTTSIPGTDLNTLAVNMFTSTHRINRFVRRHYKDSDTSILDSPIAVIVNRDTAPDGNGGQAAFVCNAFYNGSISMAKEGTTGNVTCANMGLINDVLYHEWGHALDNFTGRVGGITDGAFSEGIGDIVASYYVNSSNMASGFFINNVTGIRQLDNTFKYPDEGPDKGADREVHDEGRIIGGAFWHMREELMKRYGDEVGAHKAESLFFNQLLVADAYLESYESLVRLDDDDGNAATKSPNFCLINAAFARHGLATLEADCTDAPQGADVPFDEDMFIGIASETATKVNLMASAKKDTARIDMCLGTWEKCIASGQVDLKFVPAGTSGERELFVASKEIDALGEQETITLLAKDPYGKVVGVKTLKFVKK